MFGVIGDPHIQLYGTDPDNLQEYRTTQWFRDNVERLSKLDLDFVLITGDLVHHGQMDEYNIAVSTLDRLHTKIYWCLGNHDVIFTHRMPGLPHVPRSPIYELHPKQYVVRVGDYNLLVLSYFEWDKYPLEINQDLPSIALIHQTSVTGTTLIFPLFDNPKLDDFLAEHNVTCVIQGHVHKAGHKEAYHKGIRYINVKAAELGLGILGEPILYVPVTRHESIEEARLKLLSMRRNT